MGYFNVFSWLIMFSKRKYAFCLVNLPMDTKRTDSFFLGGSGMISLDLSMIS